MNSEELKKAVRKAAVDKNINGVMELSTLCDISTPRVIKVWHGDTNSKLSDYVHVFSVLGLKLKWISK